MSKTTDNEAPGGVTIVEMGEEKNLLTAKQVWKGQPKIGKTSTAAALGAISKKYDLGIKPFFMLFEAGSGGVTVEGTSKKCPDCEGTGKAGKKRCETCKGTGIVRLILSTLEEAREWFTWAAKSDYNPIVIDTVDAMFQVISDGVAKEQGVASPQTANDHGITWSEIYDTVRELLSVLNDKGVIMLAHIYMQEKRTKQGSVMVASFNIPGKSRQFIEGMANQILHFDVVPNTEGEGDKHVVIARPQSGIEAGDQWNLFPEMLDLGKSAEEAAEAILEVFGYIERK